MYYEQFIRTEEVTFRTFFGERSDPLCVLAVSIHLVVPVLDHLAVCRGVRQVTTTEAIFRTVLKTVPNNYMIQSRVPEFRAARANDFFLLQQLDFNGVLTAATGTPSHVFVVLDVGLRNHLVVLLAHLDILNQLANCHFVHIDVAVLCGARNNWKN